MTDQDHLTIEIASLVDREHDETVFALVLLAPVALVLACEKPALLWLPLAIAFAITLRHMLTLQRVATGRFGNNPGEIREILSHAARRQDERDSLKG